MAYGVADSLLGSNPDGRSAFCLSRIGRRDPTLLHERSQNCAPENQTPHSPLRPAAQRVTCPLLVGWLSAGFEHKTTLVTASSS
jgi:hypothetical protein